MPYLNRTSRFPGSNNILIMDVEDSGMIFFKVPYRVFYLPQVMAKIETHSDPVIEVFHIFKNIIGLWIYAIPGP